MSRRMIGALGGAVAATLALSGVIALGQDASPAMSPGAEPAASPGAEPAASPRAEPAASPGAEPATSPEIEPGPYGATLRSGTCDELGDVAAVLADPMVGARTDPDAAPLELGPTPAQPVRMSESEVPRPLADIAESGHTVVVDDPVAGRLIACGAVGGLALGDERLAIALTDPEDGVVGVALLSALGSEATNVLVLLALPDERSEVPEETPGPSPSPDAEGFTEPDPDEPGPDPDPDVDPGEDIDEDVSA